MPRGKRRGKRGQARPQLGYLDDRGASAGDDYKWSGSADDWFDTFDPWAGEEESDARLIHGGAGGDEGFTYSLGGGGDATRETAPQPESGGGGGGGGSASVAQSLMTPAFSFTADVGAAQRAPAAAPAAASPVREPVDDTSDVDFDTFDQLAFLPRVAPGMVQVLEGGVEGACKLVRLAAVFEGPAAGALASRAPAVDVLILESAVRLSRHGHTRRSKKRNLKVIKRVRVPLTRVSPAALRRRGDSGAGSAPGAVAAREVVWMGEVPGAPTVLREQRVGVASVDGTSLGTRTARRGAATPQAASSLALLAESGAVLRVGSKFRAPEPRNLVLGWQLAVEAPDGSPLPPIGTPSMWLVGEASDEWLHEAAIDGNGSDDSDGGGAARRGAGDAASRQLLDTSDDDVDEATSAAPRAPPAGLPPRAAPAASLSTRFEAPTSAPPDLRRASSAPTGSQAQAAALLVTCKNCRKRVERAAWSSRASPPRPPPLPRCA